MTDWVRVSHADKRPIADRITRALEEGPRSYHDLMREVFPPNDYDKAWRNATGGGPPGCAMAFGKALRLLGIPYDTRSDLPHYMIKLPRSNGK